MKTDVLNLASALDVINSLALDVINSLRPVTFKYIPESGFIAQELRESLKNQVYVDGIVQQGTEYLNVAYQNLIPILVKSIQELKAEIEILKSQHAHINKLRG